MDLATVDQAAVDLVIMSLVRLSKRNLVAVGLLDFFGVDLAEVGLVRLVLC